MNKPQLPQITGDRLFLTDGGLETTLIFHEGLDLPHFAAFPLLSDDGGRAVLRRYFHTYAGLARKYDTGFILESPTHRLAWAPTKRALIILNKSVSFVTRGPTL